MLLNRQRLLSLLWLTVTLLSTSAALAQTAITAGSGSYSSALAATGTPGDDGFYGPSINDMLLYYQGGANGVTSGSTKYSLYMSPSLMTRAIPTNQWWTDLAFSVRNGGGGVWTQSPLTSSLWVYPHVVAPTAAGMWLFFPSAFENRATNSPVSYMNAGPYLQVDGITNGHTFAAAHPVVTAYGDWTVSYSETDATSNGTFTTTLARGVPYVWVQYSNTNPEIAINGGTVLDSNGNPISLTGSFTATSLTITQRGKTFGVFAPPNTTFNVTGNYIVPQLGASGYMVYGVLPDPTKLTEFAQYAYAMPTASQMTYTYSPTAGTIVTNWNLTTTALSGTNTQTLQGWLPHHYHNTVNNLTFRPYAYLTPRGIMQIAPGNSWQITYPFRGIAPMLPAPTDTTAAQNPYQPSRMQAYVNNYETGGNHPVFVADSYNQGKELGEAAQNLVFADQMGLTTPKSAIISNTETLLDNWFTYTPGKGSEYFGLLGNYGGLIGVPMSFGTAAFNDNHFHYGYFALASAITGLYDPTWLGNYGPMVMKVAKEYANWDRTDTTFPYLRVFDAWEGHSWASGYSGQFGENQESSSESINAWVGLFMLGNALQGTSQNSQAAAITAAGAMGYTMETAATNEYWQDFKHTNFPAGYTFNEVGIVAAGQIQYQNNFSAEPAWNYAIQMIPIEHWNNYLSRDPVYSLASFNNIFAERTLTQQDGIAGYSVPDANNSWAVFTHDPGNYLLGYQALFDPNTLASEEDSYYAASDDIATATLAAADSAAPGAVYYIDHSLRTLGVQDYNYYTNIPTSQVYYNATTGVRTALIYNPLSTSQTATIYNNGTVVTTTTAPSHQLLVFNVGGGALVTAPAAPAGLAATAGVGQVSLSWGSVTGATSYTLVRNNSGGGYTFTGLTTTSYVDTGLLSGGMNYTYKVFAVNSNGMSAPSSPVSVRLYGTGTQTVIDYLYDLNGPTSRTASWYTNGGDLNDFGYDGLATRYVDDTESLVYSFPNLSNFNATVWTLNGPISVVSFSTSVDNGSTYQALAVNTGAATKPSAWTYYNITPAAALPAGVTNLKITMTSGTGNAWDPEIGPISFTYTNGSASIPSAPTGLTAAPGNAQISLSWTGSSAATSYNVYRGTSAGGEAATAIATGVLTTTYTNTGLTNGTTYYYKVAAVNSAGTSGQSNEASATPVVSLPSAPTGLTAVSGNTQVTLSWTASAGATSYNVYRGTTAGGEAATPITTGVATTTYTNTGLTNGTAYYFKVAAVDTAGTSAQSNEASATPSTSVTDFLNDWTVVSSKSANWTLDTTNPTYFNGDTSRATRTVADTENLVYSFSNISSFSALVYAYTDPISDVSFWYSTNNGSTYTQATVNSGTITPTTASWGYYTVTNAGALPAGVTNLEVQFTGAGNAWDPQLGQITINYGAGASAPAAPTGLTATGSNADVTLGWTASSGATSYNVYRGTTAGGESTTAIATGITTTTYDNSGLTNGTTYYYKVAAVNASGTSGQSNEASATPQVGAPAAPTGLTATGSNADVTLSWAASSGATSYNVYRGTTAGGESATAIVTGVTTTTYDNSGLTNGTTYYYKVAAVNAGGTSGQSNEASATPQVGAPAAPTGLTATASPADVKLSWTASSGATSYNVYRGTTAGGESTTAIVTGVTTTTYDNSGLTNGTTYYYKVAAVNAGGTSGQSNEASATPQVGAPAAPTGLTATGSNADVTLSWAASSGATSYNVYRGTTAGGESTTAIVTGVTTTTYDNSGLTNGTTYYYKVSAVNAGGTSGQSNEASATPQVAVPAAPTGLTATASPADVRLSWTASSGATSYNVYRGTTAGGESATAIATGITTTTYDNSGLTNGTTYYYKVAALNSAGTSAQSNEASATPQVTAPAAPTGLTATAGNAQVSLSWTASSGATSYNVYRGTTAGGESATAILTGVTTATYTNTGLTNGTAYYYKVSAVNAGGTSGQSNEASATPTAGTGEAPYGGTAAAIPGTVQAENYDTGGQGVAYNMTSTNGSANSYRTDGIDLEACTDTGAGYNIGWTAAGQWMKYTVNVATAGTYTVSFRLAATTAVTGGLHISNAAGTNLTGEINVPNTGGWQTWTTVTATVTLPAGQQILTINQDVAGWNLNYVAFAGAGLAAPTGLTATAGSAQVSLSWTASSGATSYNVYRGTAAGGESATAIATGITVVTYTNTGLTNGTTYYYKVAAVNASGTSAQSSEVSATPSAGGGTTGSASVNCGGSASSPFVADTDFAGGSTTSTTSAITTTLISAPIPPQAVLQSARTGAVTYTFGGFTAGTGHTIALYFADFTSTAAGQRNFNVSINGTAGLTNFDVFAATGGSNRAIQENFSTLANSSGQVVITITAGTAGTPIVNAITVT